MSVPLSRTANQPTIFFVKRSRLRGRLDAEYNFALLTSRIASKYPHKKLREIASFRTGGTPSKSRPDYWEGDIPWASPKDFRSFYLTETEDHISQEAVVESSTTLVPSGTLLVVFRSGILQHSLPVTITTKETAINQDLKAIIFGRDISAEYAGVYFVVFGKQLLPLVTKSGATVQSINTEQFEQLEIPILPKEAQRVAVSKLLSAYDVKRTKDFQAEQLLAGIDGVLLEELGIRRKTEALSKLDERIFRSCLHQLTGRRWDPNYFISMTRFLKEIESCQFPIRPLKDSLALVQYGISERATEEVAGVPMLRMLNLQDGDWDISNLKYIVMDEHQQQNYLLNQGDILFNRTNSKELVGKCNVFNLPGEYVFASYLMRVRLRDDSELLPEYVVAYLGSSLGRIQIDAVSRQIAGMSNINAEEVRDLLIPVPPRSIQDLICMRVAEARQRATQLRTQAAVELEETKSDIEALILGEVIV